MTWNLDRYVEEVINRFKNTSKETVFLDKEDFNLPHDSTVEKNEDEEMNNNGVLRIDFGEK